MESSPATEIPGSERASLAAPAIRGSLWTLSGYAASQALRLAGNLLLTRLLFPTVFGQMALVFTFIQGLQMFSDVGTGPAIVQNARGDDERFLNTAWTIQCARGVALWLVSWAIAWPAAAFYGQPTLRWLIPAVGATALLAGFESTAVHSVQRHLRLERLTVLDLAAQVVGVAATAIIAVGHRAVLGPDHPTAVWAIVAGSLLSSGTRLVLSHTYLGGVRNRLQLDREAATRLFRFGRWIFVSTVLTFLAGQSDRLVFGKLIPIADFGVYSIAVMLAAFPTNAVLRLGGAVVFPAYSRVVGRHDFRSVFWRVRMPILLGGAAIVAALIGSGKPLVRLLYDDRYADAGWILQYLSAAAWLQILECTNGAALLAKGRVRIVAAGSAAKVAGLAVFVPLGFRLWGFEGGVGGIVLAELAKYLTSAGGATLSGLRGFERDLGVTTVLAASAGVASAVGERILSLGHPLVGAIGVAVLVAGAPSGAALAWALLRRRPREAC